MIVKKKKGWNFDPNTWNGKFYIPYKNPWNRKFYILRKRKGWIFYPNTWNYKFYIPYKIDKEKIKKILT